MCFWLRYILALSAATLLVLPAGWCCFAPPRAAVRANAAASAVAGEEPGCCHRVPSHADHGTTPEREEAPAAPKTSCCCVVEAPLPTGPETSVAQPAVASLVLLVSEADYPAVGYDPVPDIQPHASPPPRLLHCVWIC
jgi:hypothetical protein